MNSETKTRVLYENLDTSFVNLWALLRYLSQRSFVGRVHVELKDYSADVFMTGSNQPLVHEIDREAGTEVTEEAALHRLVLRVRESPGSISVLEGEAETRPVQSEAEKSEAPEQPSELPATDDGHDETVAATPETIVPAVVDEVTETRTEVAAAQPEGATDPAAWNEVVRASGEIIGGVERAVISGGGDFDSLFRESRIALSDDYTFLDPMTGHLEYKDSAVQLNGDLPPNAYVAGISESLRRVVDQIATGDRARRARERVALELARVARKNDDAMTRSGFKPLLDRIAGTKVV